ncbi:MAG: hypothetical protein HFJ28_01145 [Clostridia bacterium]|nr:hypothetical protein [Clostridia bacterium]
MLKNYNGSINRTLFRDLMKLCEVNSENSKILLQTYSQKGEVSFYTNLDPFTRCPDEMSEVVTLKSEDEIKDYLKKDFLERLTGYLSFKAPDNDPLTNALIDFIKNSSGIYPTREEMRQLEIAAENIRLATPSATAKTTVALSPVQELLKEILQLAEEIIESRRQTKPEDIFIHVEPYPDTLTLDSNGFSFFIKWARFYNENNCTDYSVIVSSLNDSLIDKIYFNYNFSAIPVVYAEDHEVTVPSHQLIKIHQAIVALASQEGIEFLSEVDYEKISC